MKEYKIKKNRNLSQENSEIYGGKYKFNIYLTS